MSAGIKSSGVGAAIGLGLGLGVGFVFWQTEWNTTVVASILAGLFVLVRVCLFFRSRRRGPAPAPGRYRPKVVYHKHDRDRPGGSPYPRDGRCTFWELWHKDVLIGDPYGIGPDLEEGKPQ